MEDRKEDLEKDTIEEELTGDEKVEDDQSPKYFHSSGSSEIYAGKSRSSSGKKIPVLLGIAIIILVGGASIYFLRARPAGEAKPTSIPVSESPLLGPESTSSPQPSFDRSKYTLRVLNGTKLNGLAASASSKLKDLGYKIERTGNATNSAFLKTVVRVKPDLEELLENLLKDLSTLDFKGEEGPELKDSDSSDGEVILGEG